MEREASPSHIMEGSHLGFIYLQMRAEGAYMDTGKYTKLTRNGRWPKITMLSRRKTTEPSGFLISLVALRNAMSAYGD